jgi:hypothetical protein
LLNPKFSYCHLAIDGWEWKSPILLSKQRGFTLEFGGYIVIINAFTSS